MNGISFFTKETQRASSPHLPQEDTERGLSQETGCRLSPDTKSASLDFSIPRLRDCEK